MAVAPEEIIKEMRAGKFRPFYFLQGEEPWFMDVIMQLAEKNALAEQERGFNLTIMYGRDTNLASVINNARRFPMMAERQVVLVREAQELGELNREEGAKTLENYVKNPVPSTVLILAYKNKTLDGRKQLAKTIDSKAVLADCKKVPDYKLFDWVQGYARDSKMNLSPEAAHLLAEYIGNDLGRMVSEMEKLRINLPDPDAKVTPAVVQKFVGISRDYNIFELQKALVARDVLKANRIVNHFAADPKSNPLVVNVSVLFNFFSRLLLAHAAPDRSDAGLAKALKIAPFAAKEYSAALKKYSAEQLINIIGYIRTADLSSKGVDSGNATEEEILKELVFKIMH